MKTIVIVLFYALVLPDTTNSVVVVTRTGPIIPAQRRVIRGHFQPPQQRPSPGWMPGRARQARGSSTQSLPTAMPTGGFPIAMPPGGLPIAMPTGGSYTGTSYPGASNPGIAPPHVLPVDTLIRLISAVGDGIQKTANSPATGFDQSSNNVGTSSRETGTEFSTGLVRTGSTVGTGLQGTANGVVMQAIAPANAGGSGTRETLAATDLEAIATMSNLAANFQELANQPGPGIVTALNAMGSSSQDALTRVLAAMKPAAPSEYGYRKRRRV